MLYTNQLIFSKTLFCQKKVSYWKKSAILKNLKKLFSMDLRFRNWTYIQTSFRLKKHYATSSSQDRCVCRIFVNKISISCFDNNEQIRYLYLSIFSLSIGHLFDRKSVFIWLLLNIRFTKIRQAHLAWLEEVAWCFLSRKLVCM